MLRLVAVAPTHSAEPTQALRWGTMQRARKRAGEHVGDARLPERLHDSRQDRVNRGVGCHKAQTPAASYNLARKIRDAVLVHAAGRHGGTRHSYRRQSETYEPAPSVGELQPGLLQLLVMCQAREQRSIAWDAGGGHGKATTGPSVVCKLHER